MDVIMDVMSYGDEGRVSGFPNVPSPRELDPGVISSYWNLCEGEGEGERERESENENENERALILHLFPHQQHQPRLLQRCQVANP